MNARIDRWIAHRDDAVWGPHGIATLAATHWLDDQPRALSDTPGLWRTDGAEVIGVIDGEAVRLTPGGEHRHGALLLRGFARDGMLALRVLDPGAPDRLGISRIERFAFQPGAAVRGRVHRTPPTPTPRVSVDGHHSSTAYGATVSFDWEGEAVVLAVDVEDDGSLFAAFADATSGTQSHHFRFLRLPAPSADGTVDVDLNRAYLPPCAFSDHYVCVFPPPQNRLTVPVRAGEARVV